MARPPFAEVVKDAQQRGKLILMDGPMGTELMRSGLDPSVSSTLAWNLFHPDAVQVVYEDYVNAGAEVLLTNTFQAHLGYLRGEEDWREAVKAAVEHARVPEWDHLYVVGDIGSAMGDDEQSIAALMKCALDLKICDALLFETQMRLDRMRFLIEKTRLHEFAIPVMVSFSFSRLPRSDSCWVVESCDDSQKMASDVATWAEQHRKGLLALGTNCGSNLRLKDHLQIIKDFREKTSLPLLFKPGITDTLECEFLPGELASMVKSFADAGVTLIGGCCGTTPSHIAAVRREIDKLGLNWQE